MNFKPVKYTNPQTGRLESLFFAHLEAIAIYMQHLDVLLLDCTYKTNRFRMPLLNICSVIGNRKTVHTHGLCFLSGKKEGDYKWAIEQFHNVIEEGISELLLVVTDRELALMNTLYTQFLNSNCILYT